MRRHRALAICQFACLVWLASLGLHGNAAESIRDLKDSSTFRGPIDFVLDQEDRVAVVANQLSSTVSVVELETAKVIFELSVGAHPTGIHKISEGMFAVSCRDSGTIELLELTLPAGGTADRLDLVRLQSIETGMHPQGITGDADRLFVSLHASGEVVEIDLKDMEVVRRLPTGRWPAALAYLPKLDRLIVALAGESRISTIDLETGEETHDNVLSGAINFGQLAVDQESSQAYFPWMIYRSNPISPRDIQRGWVLASRIARVNGAEESYREAISLDVPGKAMSDPYGITFSQAENVLVCSSSGTGELLFYRLADIPFETNGGPGDLVNPALSRDPSRFSRIFVGGRPMTLHMAADGTTAWCVDYLTDQLLAIDLRERRVASKVSLGEQPREGLDAIVHRGRAVFYDARYSLDQWYSCHSCHVDGGTNAKAMDTWNDGSELTTKTVLPLHNVMDTSPWTWHGWQQDLRQSLENSFVSTMKGHTPGNEDLDALEAYLASLEPPPNPFAKTTERTMLEKGKQVFSAAGCADCHSGRYFTDGQIHSVGLESTDDAYEGYNTPSLVGVYRKPRLLHDGRSRTIRDALETWHLPEDLGNGLELSESELAALIAYLKTL